MKGQVACLLLLATKIALIAGHAMWTCPAPRVQDSFLKQGPCGGPGFGNITDTPQVTINPGPFTVIYQETVFHTGAPFRIALSQPGVDNFEECILLNHIPHNDNGAGGQYYAVTVNIPDFYCPQCSLQLIQVMTDKIQFFLPAGTTNCTYNPNDTMNWNGTEGNQCGSDYHSCANVFINGTQDFNASMCLQPNGYNLGAGFGQYDYIYGHEPGSWMNGLLSDSRTPDSVRTLVNGTACTDIVATTLANAYAAVTPSPTSSASAPTAAAPAGVNSDNTKQSNAGVTAAVVIVTIVVFVAVFGVYTYISKKKKGADEYTSMPKGTEMSK
jgi:hypothetical protein